MTADAVVLRPEPKLRSYARLAKLDVFDYYLSVPLVLAAVSAQAGRLDLGVLPMLLAFGLGEVCVLAALVALDDLTGYRDGSDIANYAPDAPLRRKLRKPLVAGTLTEREVAGFATAAAAAGGLLWTVAVALAPHRPVWLVVAIAVLFVISLQYSYGIKLSYHGFQELFIAALGWALVLAPYALVTGGASAFVVTQALLFGLGPLLFGVYSNTNDIEGDRGIGRPTVAALVSPTANAVFIGALSAAEFAIVLTATVAGFAPWWFVPLMLPVTVLRAAQWYTGFRRGDIMRARRMGFTIHRVSTVLLIAASVLLVGTAA
ncbi:UbiA family prenyltransferase [Amycolatopsis thermalba]|uniref:UbiA family prenyltransferase n=1 Tax=Amycolatopsis thermalba TaxID=944492 RepID=A0ABY4NXF9_9PSEU|nr:MULTISPECIES: UbiA family prenyltransferase [Amycolatopsis]UQS24755.1 UbiA family prenyltransferase [Amycolatopsis thermalba]